MALKAYALYIFDWDGTVVDSADTIATVMQDAATAASVPVPTKPQVHQIIGLELEEAIARLFPDGLSADERQRVEDHYREGFIKHTEKHGVTPFGGALDALHRLQQSGRMLAVATGKRRRGLQRHLDQMELGSLFAVTRCADETAGKPDPRMLQEILQVTGVPVQEALMIGDTSYDLEMAARIGMDAVGVTYGVHASEQLLAHNPVTLINHLDELTHHD